MTAQPQQDRNSGSATTIAAIERAADVLLFMAAWDGLSGPEIAGILGISVAATDQRIHRAKRRLAASLSPAMAQRSTRMSVSLAPIWNTISTWVSVRRSCFRPICPRKIRNLPA